MTDHHRVDALRDLLERVQRNAREPRPAFLAVTDPREAEHGPETRLDPMSGRASNLREIAPLPPTISFSRPEVNHFDDAPESMAFDLVPAPKAPPSTRGFSERRPDGYRDVPRVHEMDGDSEAPYSQRAPDSTGDDRLTQLNVQRPDFDAPVSSQQRFGDETTAQANVDEVEDLLLREQEEAQKRKQIRFEESPPLAAAGPPESDADGPDLLVIDDFELDSELAAEVAADAAANEGAVTHEGAVTEPPQSSAVPSIPAAALEPAALPDVDAIEANLLDPAEERDDESREEPDDDSMEEPIEERVTAQRRILDDLLAPADEPPVSSEPSGVPTPRGAPILPARVESPPVELPRDEPIREGLHLKPPPAPPTINDQPRHEPTVGADFMEEPTGERLKSTPPLDDDVPSSVRQAREGERPVDVQFDGFDPQPASEPPPESGEVPSYRATALREELDAVPHELTASQGEAELEPVESPLVEEPEILDLDADGAPMVELDLGASADYEETKEVRALGRVDIVERSAIDGPAEIVVLKGARAVETFGAILDEALAIGQGH